MVAVALLGAVPTLAAAARTTIGGKIGIKENRSLSTRGRCTTTLARASGISNRARRQLMRRTASISRFCPDHRRSTGAPGWASS